MMNFKTVKEDYNEFNFNDFKEYNAFLQNSFSKFVEMSTANKDIEKVLVTYNQKQFTAITFINFFNRKHWKLEY